MKSFVIKHLPNKFVFNIKDKNLPKGKKSKSPRNQVCKVDKDGPVIYLLYVKLTNYLPISEKENDGLSKYDYAGVFETRQDAVYIADCLNKLFSWSHIYDEKYKFASPYWIKKVNGYYVVEGYYHMIGDIRRKEFMTEKLVGIVSDKNRLQQNKEYWMSRLFTTFTTKPPLPKPLGQKFIKSASPKNTFKLYIDPQIHVVRYKLNDVMPTMNLDDYSVENHKKNFNIIKSELLKYPQQQKMKQVLEDIDLIKTAPPSKLLPKGGYDYQEMVNDPEFRKRWAPWDKTFK